MPIRFRCPHCKKGLVVKEQMAGKKAACPACQKVLSVPALRSRPADLEAFAAAALSGDAPASEPAAPADGAPIEIVCPYCDSRVTFAADMGGKQAPCPNAECRRIIKVPLPHGDRQRDWREVKTGPSAARASQPQELEGAWGTVTHRGRVGEDALYEAGAIKEEKEPVGVSGWIRRGLWLTGIAAASVLAVWIIQRLGTIHDQQDNLAQALQLVEKKNPKIGATWTAVIFQGAGEFYALTKKPTEAVKYFTKARAVIRAEGIDPMDRDLFLMQLALSQIALGGSDQEAQDKERLKWDAVLQELLPTVEGIADPERRAFAVRHVASRLWRHGQPNQATSLANPLGNDPAMRAQQSALRIAWKKPGPEDAPPDWDQDVKDLVPRCAHAEGNARLGKFAEAQRIAQVKGDDLYQLTALVGLVDIAVTAGESNKVLGALGEAGQLAEKLHWKVSPALMFQLIRISALGEGTVKARKLLEHVPVEAKDDLRSWAQLELLRADLAQAKNTPVELKRAEEIDGPESLPRILAWQALARHNARLGDRPTQEADSHDDERVRAVIHLGIALGSLDRDAGR